MTRLLRTVSLFAAALLAVASVRAQCARSTSPGDPLERIQGNVDAVVSWDPDGTGPLPTQLFVGGTFDVSNVHDEHVARWDGTTWSSTSARMKRSVK